MLKKNIFKTITLIIFLVYLLIGCSDTTNNSDNNGNPATTTNDVISVKALAGTWWSLGWSEIFYLSFAENGNFAYYVATVSSSVSYWNEYFIKGKYRVQGDTIKCYNCQVDYYSGNYIGDNKYFGVSERTNLPNNILLDTNLKNPQNLDNFSILFEFFDAMRMRIILDLSVIHDIEDGDIHNYDYDFYFDNDYHNVSVPTHIIPGIPWPNNNVLIPTGTPEFCNGRIRTIDNITFSYEIRIDIDRTTRNDLTDYIESLVLSGWTLTGTTKTESVWIFSLKMGSYTLSIESENDYSFRLIFY